uniref:Uncharacterized protein n=1 Tax=Rhizophora mucronata TaxID=61149 RepID=A0A2P2PUX9_RHIMU
MNNKLIDEYALTLLYALSLGFKQKNYNRKHTIGVQDSNCYVNRSDSFNWIKLVF